MLFFRNVWINHIKQVFIITIISSKGRWLLIFLCRPKQFKYRANINVDLNHNTHGCVSNMIDRWNLIIYIDWPHCWEINITIVCCLNKCITGSLVSTSVAIPVFIQINFLCYTCFWWCISSICTKILTVNNFPIYGSFQKMLILLRSW